MPKVTKDQARELAIAFREISVLLGDLRFANWGSLTAAQRRDLEDAEWTLLNYSSDFVTTAVGIALEELDADLKAIKDATKKAKTVVKKIETVKDVLTVVSGLVVLGGAIASKNPGAIASAAGDLFNQSKKILDKHKD